ncbi:MAG: hypothetical protein IJT35_02180 [Paludibacteraceae bacterium]|nr:hypothetical protein [Paludibacteraceae bacterium]
MNLALGVRRVNPGIISTPSSINTVSSGLAQGYATNSFKSFVYKIPEILQKTSFSLSTSIECVLAIAKAGRRPSC